jgi:serine protease Do
MKQQNLWIALGLGALSLSLVALPGSASSGGQQGTPVIVQGLVADEAPGSQPGEEDLQAVLAGGGWLGVSVSEITADKAKELKLPAERGALLGKIAADGPAAKAGLKPNDVVTEINGQRIEGTAQFRRMIHEIPAGRSAQLTVWRDGKSQNIKVTVAKAETIGAMPMVMSTPGNFTFRMPNVPNMPDVQILQAFPDGGDMTVLAGAAPRLGIDAENLDGDFGSYFGAPDGEGVLVRNVFPDSAAAKAGLKSGDVIVSLNGERIRSVGELREKIAADHDGKSAKLGLLRNKAPLTVDITVPAPQTLRREHRTRAERTTI